MQIFPLEDVPIISARREARRVGWKNLFCNQNFQNDKIFSKFAEIWIEGLPSCLMLSQGSFGQDSEWIRPFPTFQCSSQPRLQDLHPSSANVCAGPIVFLHVPEHVFVPIGLHQELLQMNVDSLKASLPLKWCHVTLSLSGQFTVFTDLPQLYERVLMTKVRPLPHHVEIVLALLMKSTRPLPPRVEIVLVVMLQTRLWRLSNM